MRLVDYLHRNAELYPEKTAAICGGEKITWRELSSSVIGRASCFKEGQVVAFRSSQSIDFLITYFSDETIFFWAAKLGLLFRIHKLVAIF